MGSYRCCSDGFDAKLPGTCTKGHFYPSSLHRIGVVVDDPLQGHVPAQGRLTNFFEQAAGLQKSIGLILNEPVTERQQRQHIGAVAHGGFQQFKTRVGVEQSLPGRVGKSPIVTRPVVGWP